MKIKVKDLANGIILWEGSKILGIKGVTLNEKYYECNCIKIPGSNSLDYELVKE